MVKAKDFFKVLCEDLNYRFFSGVACSGLAPLFKNMDPSFLHYVPAVNEVTALGLACGASIAGLNSCIIMDMKFKEDLYSNFKFTVQYKIPILIIGYSENKKEDFKFDIPIKVFNGDKDIKSLSKKMEKESSPGILIIGKDVIL
jgi:sulfopyruvate decarboxylase TPP-binding subunit